jgi:peptidoglycan/LPS O-acetylase OafA/YrhL
LCIGVALLAITEPPAEDDLARLLDYGVAAVLIVGAMVGIEVAGKLRVGRLPRWLGDASYSIYLSHTLVIAALWKVWPHGAAPWMFLAGATVCAALAGGAVYVLLERPLLALMRGRRPAWFHLLSNRRVPHAGGI